MIDDLILVMDIDLPDMVLRRCCVSFEYLGMVFNPIYRNGCVIRYESNYRNLRVKLNYDKLVLSGSWHKFYHGNNWGEYTWEEIGLTVNELLEVFGEPLLKAKITKLTFSCNLITDPKPIISKITAIKGVPPSEMLGGTNHKMYGKYHRMTHYRFKVYDKQTEVNIHDKCKIEPILRIEKELQMNAARRRATNPLRISNPLDLFKPEFYQECLNELLSVVFNIEFSNSLQVEDMKSSMDLEAFVMINDLNVRDHYKKLVTPKTFRSKKNRFNEMVSEYNQEDLRYSLEREVCFKVTELAGRMTIQNTG